MNSILLAALSVLAWTDVPAPLNPLVAGFSDEQSQISNHTWLYPFTEPTPAGVYEVSNAIIDKSQRLGVWSQAATITPQSGWYLYAGGWNQPVSSDDAGIAWRVKVISSTPQFDFTPFTPGSEHYFYMGWGGQYMPNTIAPYSFSLPRLTELKQDPRRVYRINMFTIGGRHTVVAPAPICQVNNLPLVPMDIHWCRVTENGETALSPAFVFTPPTPHAGWRVADTCELPFGLQEYHPQGTLGYHVYVKLQGGVLQRIPAPHCYGTPAGPDDWLFQWHDRQPIVRRIVPNAPTHVLANPPRSRLNSLQVKLRNTDGNIEVPANTILKTYCPIIDEWRTNGISATFGRRIASADGGQWTIQQQPSLSGHKYWPVLAIENSYSQWDGVTVQANGGSAALTFGDYSGGQAFGNRFSNCNFNAAASDTGVTCGILIDTKSTGQFFSHTASETRFKNTKGNGWIPIWVGGNQSAGIRFDETNITSLGNDRRASAVYLECPNQVVFSNGLNVDARYGGAVFRASAYNAKLFVNGVWLDQESSCILEACGVSFDAKFDAGKFNIRGTSPVLARLIDQHNPSKLLFSDLDTQPDPGVPGIDVINGNYNAVELRFTDTYLSEFTVLREPDRDQTTALLRTIMYDTSLVATEVPIPGMRLSVPTEVSPVSFIGPVQEISVVFNSLTGRQQVKRTSWTD